LKKNAKARQKAVRTGKTLGPAKGPAQPAVPDAVKPSASRPIPVVGVGISQGGLEAFTALLRALPDDTSMAFVLVQHMDPGHESALNKILSRATGMPVNEVSDGMAVKPNHVYLIPSNVEMTFRDGVWRLAKQSEAALLLYQQELRALTAKLISVQEENSKYLARELHDVFSQKLAVLSMEISALEQRPPESPEALGNQLRQIAEQIGGLAKDIHQMSRQLHPAILDDLGLAAALNNECLAFSEQHGIPVKLTPQNVREPLPEDVSLCLYRVAQESLRNIGKHAGATEVRVALAGGTGEITLVIEDFGDGFDLDQVRGKGGLGLVSMDERVRLVGGTFSVQSEPGTGTRVEVRVPLRRGQA